MADISNVPELVDRTVYPLMFDTYERQPNVREQLFPVAAVSKFGDPYGVKGSVITNVQRPIEVHDGEESPATDIKSGYTYYLKIREISRRIDIPRRMMESSNAVGRVTSLLAQIGAGWGETFALWKEDFVADILQKGSLTAGDRARFDNSFPNEADPHAGFIFDGLPLFDTAHTLAAASGTYANHVVSSALTSANLGTALDAMRVTNAVSETGERVAIRPDTLLVPAGSMGRTARTLLNSALLPGGSNNDINTLNGELSVVEWAHLDDSASASAWWLVQRGKGIQMYDSGAPLIETAFDQKAKQWFVVATSFFGAACINWRHLYLANKAAA